MLLANYNHARDVTLRCGYVEGYAETDVSSPSPRNMSFNFFFIFIRDEAEQKGISPTQLLAFVAFDDHTEYKLEVGKQNLFYSISLGSFLFKKKKTDVLTPKIMIF